MIGAPAISVLVPVYNGIPYLPDALASVLQQTWRDFEVVVIDDASTDASWEVIRACRDARVRAFRNERNLGLPGTLNRGLALCQGEWIARQDQDDLCHPARLEAQLMHVREHPDVMLLFSDASIIDANGKYRGRRRTVSEPAEVRWDLCFRCNFPHSAAFLNRAVVESVGGYREMHACEDYDLWSRVGKIAAISSLRRPLMRYRVHERSMMGVENKARLVKSAPFLREIMLRNFDHFVGAGVPPESVETMVNAWIELPERGWRGYFESRESAARTYAGAGTPGFRKLLGEQDYTLMCRLAGRKRRLAVDFLGARMRACPSRTMNFPWVRAMAALALAG
jgi:glycosyltransferase involved in cell wall biosynthesis